MAEKDTQLIVAYFATADEAKAAGEELKAWDKENKRVKLGAMSILTMNDKGELKEDKVGARAGGKGAKWGVLAGAALGILSGGVTLIGGALVGLAAGGLGGAFFHKAIGMSDADQAQLVNHLQGGGAALAVMMDEEEMEPTINELRQLNADVDTYNVPQELLDDMARAANSEAVIHELAQKYKSEETE